MYVIRKLQHIRALASPARLAIVDAIEALGPSSAVELGEVLGQPSDRLYYHLQILKSAGLVHARQERNHRGRRQERFDLPGRPTRLEYRPADPKNVAAVSRVIGSTLREAHRSFRRALTAGEMGSGRESRLWAGRRTGWLGPGEVREINALFARATRILQRPRHGRPGARLYSLTFAFSPYGRGVEERPSRRAATSRPRR